MSRHLRVLRSMLAVGGLSLMVGCQTWIAGMTLPSPHYLQHYPQYFPPDPDFPLQNELQTQIDYSGLLKGEEQGNGNLPAAVPPAGPPR